ncbi:hypothetical protein [Streptomyces solaniscabiei]|uniref:hypothetical protein n=1 Tax=Streptomyces solaniscabiei TaxID=2683255 RepID=UPI001CE3500F|nr:hypothetical protein [Streptomyces solaniscabiei]
MTDIRLGLIGAGAVGVLHAEAATGAPGVHVTAVCYIVSGTAERVAKPVRDPPPKSEGDGSLGNG